MENKEQYSWYCTYSMECEKRDCRCYRGKAFIVHTHDIPFCNSKPENHKIVEGIFLYKMEMTLRNER